MGLSLDAERIEINDGARVGTQTFGTGAAGDVVVRGETVEIAGGTNGAALLFSLANPSPGTSIVGDSGRVLVETEHLALSNGGRISTSTSGTGDAGLIHIDAGNVEIRGAQARRFG